MRERDRGPAQPGKSAPRTDPGQRTFGPIPSALRLNHVTAERLREAAVLLAQQDDNVFRVAAYRRAADAVQSLSRDIGDIVCAGGMEALEQIPGVGRGIAAALVEMLRTGRWGYLERLRGSSEPYGIFRVIPGIGPELARRLHEDLEVETLEQLEAALYASRHRKVKGIGPRRLASLRASLNQALARRVVRGREAECLEFYNQAPASGADVGKPTWPPETT